MRRRFPAVLTVVLGVSGLAAGCGVDVEGSDRLPSAGAAFTTPAAKAAAARRSAAARRRQLPRRPAGQVAIDGDTRGSLSALVASAVSGARVSVAGSGAQAAFASLCRGRIDVVDSVRPIQPAEWRRCQASGLDVVQFQVAADATVVATKNESDVGVDCLTLAQVRDIFRAGSPVTNWNQVHGLDLPLRTSGPDAGGSGFAFFTQFALGTDLSSLTAYRDDYRQYNTDKGVRTQVVGSGRAQTFAARADRVRRDVDSLNRAISDKQRGVSSARAAVRKSRRDNWTPRQKAAARARARSEQRLLDGLTADRRRAKDYLGRLVSQQRRTARAERGWVGYFSFSYYELFEEQLRPIEIDAGTTQRPNCVFPSQQTVTDATFPLARQLLITVTLPGLRRAAERAFLLSYLQRARALAGANRLVPLPEEEIRRQQQIVQGQQPPSVVFYPSPRRARRASSQPPARTPAGRTPRPAKGASTTTLTTTPTAPATVPTTPAAAPSAATTAPAPAGGTP